jgi:hypothetical protein
MSFLFLILACRNYGKGYIDVVQDEGMNEDSAALLEPEESPEPTVEPESEPTSTPTSEPTVEPESNEPDTEPTSEPESEPTSEPESNEPTLTTWSENAVSDGNGSLKVTIDLPANAVSLMITSESEAHIFVDRFEDANGVPVYNWADWNNSSELLTMAMYPDPVNVFNWPIRATDTELSAGTWELSLVTLSLVGSDYYYAGNTPVDLRIQYKTDPDLTEATVTARIVYANGVENNTEVVSAVSQAIGYWSDVWDAANITLIHDIQNENIDATLPFIGDSAIAQLSANTSEDEILIIIGETVANEENLLGISGGIPGSLVDTNNSVMMVSWLNNAGPDGVFDAMETEMLGVTMVHEIGHYMGLFHPVEIDLNYWDALDDTAYCTTLQQCENLLGTNLMYPYPVYQSNGMLGIKEITGEQQSILHRYTGSL